MRNRPVIAFGPEMPGWGSWDWVGSDLAEELARSNRIVTFGSQHVPECEIMIVIKHAPALQWVVERVSRRAAVIYCPVDYYGCAAAIDADGAFLRKCARILVHCDRLRRYFAPYAPVESMDHHVKFAAPLREEFHPSGYFLWVGVRTNLPPFIEWVNQNPLPGELRILTNLEDPAHIPRAVDLGLRVDCHVQVSHWSPELQRTLTAGARAAIDIKGTDFRSRHKPPAKAIDFIASGVPLAMNPDSSPVEHLARLGFVVPSPLQRECWTSRAYWEETQRFGRALRELLSLERITRRFQRIIDEVSAERGMTG